MALSEMYQLTMHIEPQDQFTHYCNCATVLLLVVVGKLYNRVDVSLGLFDHQP